MPSALKYFIVFILLGISTLILGTTNVQANHLDGEGWFCEGNSVVQQLSNGDHEVWQDCGETEQCTPLDPPDGYVSDANCVTKNQSGGSGSGSGSDCPVLTSFLKPIHLPTGLIPANSQKKLCIKLIIV